MGPAGEPIEAVFREEYGRLLALLAARFGDLDLAEEVTAEALLAAVETWPRSGVPREPLAWLATTARRKALDRIRRDATLATKLATLHADADPARRAEPVAEHEHIPDDRLQLMFACCHPALDLDTQTGLTLRYLAGRRRGLPAGQRTRPDTRRDRLPLLTRREVHHPRLNRYRRRVRLVKGRYEWPEVRS